MTAKRQPAAQLDPVIHPITRLSICGLLASGADWVEFAALRDAAGISDSMLSKQSRTWFRLTPEDAADDTAAPAPGTVHATNERG